MKCQAKLKEIRALGCNVLGVGYCDVQDLLTFINWEPVYYTAGVYGWNADYYRINGWLLSTGYRPYDNMGKRGNELRKKLLQLNRNVKDGLLTKYEACSMFSDLFKTPRVFNTFITKE